LNLPNQSAARNKKKKKNKKPHPDSQNISEVELDTSNDTNPSTLLILEETVHTSQQLSPDTISIASKNDTVEPPLDETSNIEHSIQKPSKSKNKKSKDKLQSKMPDEKVIVVQEAEVTVLPHEDESLQPVENVEITSEPITEANVDVAMIDIVAPIPKQIEQPDKTESFSEKSHEVSPSPEPIKDNAKSKSKRHKKHKDKNVTFAPANDLEETISIDYMDEAPIELSTVDFNTVSTNDTEEPTSVTTYTTSYNVKDGIEHITNTSVTKTTTITTNQTFLPSQLATTTEEMNVTVPEQIETVELSGDVTRKIVMITHEEVLLQPIVHQRMELPEVKANIIQTRDEGISNVETETSRWTETTTTTAAPIITAEIENVEPATSVDVSIEIVPCDDVQLVSEEAEPKTEQKSVPEEESETSIVTDKPNKKKSKKKQRADKPETSDQKSVLENVMDVVGNTLDKIKEKN